ncbi:MAG: DNA repair protein RecO [Bacteroides sp.]|nr:DNA repair protein RecO [Bacteroides sp.]MCM1550664.1 DNA repair protein RecO [Clostridium sp.]
MQLQVTGMVLMATQVGDYDRRLVILTKERGKLSAFVRGARRTGSPLAAASQPFTYGVFTLYAGRDAYRVQSIEVQNYFDEIKTDLEGITYGSYFCEMADYFTHENLDNREQLKLLYITLRAMVKKWMPASLIRRIYEIRLLALDGEEMQVFSCVKCGNPGTGYVFRARQGGLVCVDHCQIDYNIGELLHPSTVYTLQFILGTALEKLYSFRVSQEVQGELDEICNLFLDEYVDRRFKSVEILDSIACNLTD